MEESCQIGGLLTLYKKYRFHYYDQHGAGESSRPINRFESDSMHANTQELLRTLGLSAQIAGIERIFQILGEEILIVIGLPWVDSLFPQRG
jgi:pimeloyl-ACP methyl ester carboxylesterase